MVAEFTLRAFAQRKRERTKERAEGTITIASIPEEGLKIRVLRLLHQSRVYSFVLFPPWMCLEISGFIFAFSIKPICVICIKEKGEKGIING